jgi:4-hydroxy-tetrahydrodipicolinate synthase
MKQRISRERLSGIWSAAPTPFTSKMELDVASIRTMVEHHVRLGVKGLFLAGTNGEGPWMTNRQRSQLVQAVRKYARERLVVAVQVTDNSSARILENIAQAKADGADIAVIAPPYFLLKPNPKKVLELYRQAIRQSPLPVGIYDRGKYSAVAVPEAVLKALYAEKNVVLVKDSSSDPARRAIALAARKKRPSLRVLSGDEFDCVTYLRAGYDGLLLGGGVFNGYLAGQILRAVAAGDIAAAERHQKRMIRIMFAVYGGKKIFSWLSGEKKLLVEMGIFKSWRNYLELEYPLTPSCTKAIKHVLAKDQDILFP